MAKTYAWSNIKAGDVTVKVGDEVSQSDLDVSDDEWQALIDQGTVRAIKYPEGAAASGVSPNEFYREQMAKVATGEIQPDELKELQEAGVTGDEEVQSPPVAQTEPAEAAPKSSK